MLRSDKASIELIGQNEMNFHLNENSNKQKITILSVKHGGKSLRSLGSISAHGVHILQSVAGIINRGDYLQFLTNYVKKIRRRCWKTDTGMPLDLSE